jgi:hypothetical protein
LSPLTRNLPVTGYFSAWLPSPHLAIRQRYNHQTQSIGSRFNPKAYRTSGSHKIQSLLLLPNF